MASKSKQPTNRDEAVLRDLGLSFPETTEDFPWDHRALKVKGKVFVFMGTGKEGGADHDDFFLSCKLPHSSAMALTLPEVKPTGYGLGKSGWVSAQYPRGKAPVDMLKDWIRESYCAVAPKKLAALVDSNAPPLAAKNASTKRAAVPVSAKPKAKKTAAKRAPSKQARAGRVAPTKKGAAKKKSRR
ncbi:MAG TPA: MmcQ/YjbR family DNA-binding protein [Labilithrix sp.]|nr:MmcQ/YjbR family DNA-binding protein [Labilithrix sp.]